MTLAINNASGICICRGVRDCSTKGYCTPKESASSERSCGGNCGVIIILAARVACAVDITPVKCKDRCYNKRNIAFNGDLYTEISSYLGAYLLVSYTWRDNMGRCGARRPVLVA